LILFILLLLAGSGDFRLSSGVIADGNEPEESVTPGIPVSWKITNDYSSFPASNYIDEAVQHVMYRYNIRGASVAIAVKGRLVYAKGLGYADAENQTAVSPAHLFRIASVSKLITAVAIMKLSEEGKLRLDDHVFGSSGILNDSMYRIYRDKRYEKITVEHLLRHVAGFSTRYGDPAFNPQAVAKILHKELPLKPSDLIVFALHYPLAWYPGHRYAYSNLGYIILGEVIEKITHMPYEQFVQTQILYPLGIYDMHIGKSFLAERYPNEVKYYEQFGPRLSPAVDGSDKQVERASGGIDIPLLGPAGGWIASSPELAMLMLRIDGFPEKPDILNSESIAAMTRAGYMEDDLLGWMGKDKDDNWWRTGTMTGTVAHVMRRSDNIVWIVILNTSSPRRNAIHSEIVRRMNAAIDSVQSWPPYDLLNPPAFTSISPRMPGQIQ